MRKLATFSISLALAVLAAHYFIPVTFLPYCITISIALSFLGLLFCGDTRLRIFLIAIGLAVGMIAQYVNYRSTTLPCSEIEYEERTITAELLDYPKVGNNYTLLELKLRSDDLPHVKTVIYHYGYGAEELQPGDIIEGVAKLRPADTKYGETFDRDVAEGVYLIGNSNDTLEKTGRSPFAFRFLPLKLRERIIDTADKVFPQSSKGFLTALLTGDKTGLYENPLLYSAMGKAGILHCVAVSGMHVAFLVSFLQMVIRRRKYSSLIGIPMVWIFAIMSGATPSVLRAAFMQSSVLLAPLVHRENDGITSLTAILAILLLKNPNAIASVSLQLSFTAMLGIIVLTPRIYQSASRYVKEKQKADEKNDFVHKAVYKFRYAICSAFAASVGAIAFSTPVAVLHFGYVSAVGILVNILIFWAISAAFISGYIVCLIGMIWLPLGTIVGYVSNVFAMVIIYIAGTAAKIPYSAVYTEGNGYKIWLIAVYLIFIGAWILRNKKRGFRPIIPVCIAICLLCGMIIITDIQMKQSEATFTVMDIGQGQSVVFTEGSYTAVIDCGGKGKPTNAGDTVSKYLLGNGRRSVDVLALTHFDADHVNGVIRLMSNVAVEKLLIPPDDGEHKVRYEILDFAEECGTEVYIINENTDVDMGDITLSVIAPVSEKEPTLVFLARKDEYEALITGDIDDALERKLISAYEIPDIELFVAGHHGSKYSNCSELLDAIDAETVAVSSGYNSYGHPTEEALSRFSDADMEIFRTDEEGKLVFEMVS